MCQVPSQKMLLQVGLNSERMAELESMISTGTRRTKTEILNTALTLLKWAVSEQLAGRLIASIDERNNVYKTLSMPILDDLPSIAPSDSGSRH